MLRYIQRSLAKPKTAFAKRLRVDQTTGERELWSYLRAKRFHGLKFRRQVPIDPYIVDFLCIERRVIIEVDGDSHYQPNAYLYDDRREEYLRSQGFMIFRCDNSDAVCDTNAVLERLSSALGFPAD